MSLFWDKIDDADSQNGALKGKKEETEQRLCPWTIACYCPPIVRDIKLLLMWSAWCQSKLAEIWRTCADNFGS